MNIYYPHVGFLLINLKYVNLKELDVDELNLQLKKNKEDLFKLRFRSNSAQVANVMEIRNLRKKFEILPFSESKYYIILFCKQLMMSFL